MIIFSSKKDLKISENIIYGNNRDVNRLGNYPLTPTEMKQIIEKVNAARTPYAINKLINQRLIDITRDNKDDVQNFNKNVYLKIFDPKEISAGQSRYQIVRQPIFKTALQGAATAEATLYSSSTACP